MIENGEPADQVGCVRNFHLRDGAHIREQLLALSDEEHLSTYCILDATVPLRRYVATVTLKRVTDGDRTFWHWQSTFETPPGREQELADMVGRGVYEAGFEGLRRYLREPGSASRARPTAAAPSAGDAMTGQGIVLKAFGGSDQLVYESVTAAAPGPGEVRLRQSAVGVNYIDVYIRRGEYRMVTPPAVIGMEAAGTVIDVGADVHRLLPGDRVAYAYGVPGAYAEPADAACRPGGRASHGNGFRDSGGAALQGTDRRVSAASRAPGSGGRQHPRSCRGRRRRAAALPMGEASGGTRHRHGRQRGKGAARARAWVRGGDRRARLSLCRCGEGGHATGAASMLYSTVSAPPLRLRITRRSQ